MTIKAIESAALRLPMRMRSKLAASLLTSLDGEGDSQTERIWVEEADRRYRAYKAGRTGATPAKEAIAQSRAALRE
jgi:hypothetical protein